MGANIGKFANKMDFTGISFRTALSSFFRVYGKKNTDELNPLQGVRGQNMEKSITTILTIFDVYKEIAGLKASVEEHKKNRDEEVLHRKGRTGVSLLFDATFETLVLAASGALWTDPCGRTQGDAYKAHGDEDL